MRPVARRPQLPASWRARIWLLLLGLSAAGCSRDCQPAKTIEPGVSVPTLFRCGDEPAPAARSERDMRMLEAIAPAVDFLSRARDAYALLMLDVLQRRFGIAAFQDALTHYDQVVADDGVHAPVLRVFRRIADHDNVLAPEDEAAVTTELNRLTVPALYCDRAPLPAGYAAMLEQADDRGGYARSHALLALQWLRENGCSSPAAPAYERHLLEGVAALIASDGELSDLELEAASFLFLYGQGDRVDTALIDETTARQNSDGGWLETFGDDKGSDWHATVSALFVLLHSYCGERDYPPMLAGPG